MQEQGWKTALIGKSHWHPHTAGVDLRDQIKLLQKLGFDEAEEIAGPRALAEVKCALTDDWYAYEPGLQARYRADLAERYHGGSPWRVKPSILPNHLYPDIWVGDKACDWLRQQGVSEQPWMFWVSFPGPHEPWDTPNPWAGLHRKVQLPPARPRPNWISRQPLHSECRQRELQWEQTPNNEEINTLRSDYADHLTLLDYQLSRLLKDLPELKRTSITIVSDHGELLGDAGFLYKSCFLEGAIRSLALHHRPSILKRNKRWRKPIGLSWFLNAAAEDISGIKQITRSASPKLVFSEFGEELLVTDEHRKLVLNTDGECPWATDPRKDPDEQTNLIENFEKYSGQWDLLHEAGRRHLKSN